MRIGDVEILPVFDGVGRENPHHILSRPGVENPWQCHPGVLDEHGSLNFEIGGFLVRTTDRIMLVDVGVGSVGALALGGDTVYRGGGFLTSLRSHGVAPEDVTDVLFTHFHVDHVGWATQKGEITFPNATYRAHADEWAHFVASPTAFPQAIKKLGPLSPQMELFDGSCTMAPGVDAVHSPGHTPGSTVYVVSSGGQRALMLGDVVHSVVELAEPDWQAVYDMDPAAASAVRNAIADEALGTGDLVVGAHFPRLEFGRMVMTDQGRRFRHL
jgi:glyoxylase-like metal-dependent hydrolase (beta-lactamase superfamily II)